MNNAPSTPWWRRAVVYQVYIRSFADGNGDGTGDITGLRSRLDYLQELGVDAIWINPWYVSPLNDGGYDVADYRTINPLYGDNAEAEILIAEARERGIRVMVDLVPNHTSSEHEWFRAALAAGPGSPERARYHFLDGVGDEPPTNWTSVFGGSTWTRVPDGQWYLHLFDPSQPDLNWSNPEVIDEFHDILRYWLDLGAAGFRVDVAHGMAKDHDFPDIVFADGVLDARGRQGHPYWDRDAVHPIIRGWRSVLDEYDDRMMVAEAWVENWERLARYLRPDEYHQVFDFEFLESAWRPSDLRQSIDHSLGSSSRVGSVPTWVLSNHDVVRHATRYALPQDVEAKRWLLDGDRGLLDEDAGRRRARAAALLMLALPGSVYVYQGDELGLPEVYDLPADVLDDPVWRQSGNTEKGRDGCRVPIPWEPDGPSYGFGSGEPWLPQPDGWGAFAATTQDGDPESSLNLYRSALSLRRQLLIDNEDFAWREIGEDVLAFDRPGGFTCVVNLGDAPVALPAGEVLLVSRPLEDGLLPVDTSAWVKT